ncbi:SDR family oxidoreductase [Pseudoalteromonas sp. OANN1]|uniref:SDR family oxidoreductase n=1 Tax=Pseudoalteromonas sp. OANN1 TaxID=2954497 RepID=UPI002097745D|nr:SDR family oxidoreductase [Pseudoalteromonas sp. OANN1]MCO7199911.1 SDR family oxidoreductase [Pseudoalteromonas sp. OANN1]
MTLHVLVTGANRGIGLEFCKQYLSLDCKVTAVVRKASAEVESLGVDIIEDIDVATENGAKKLLAALGSKKIDILINNAGVFHNETLAEMDFENIDHQFNVNALGPIRVTHALLDNLKAGSKVAMITSRMGSIADNGSGGYIGYRMSKAALNAASVSMAHELKNQDIAVGLFHPGFVQTQMVGFAGDIGPDVAAERLIKRIEHLTIENSGGFWHSNGDTLPW